MVIKTYKDTDKGAFNLAKDTLKFAKEKEKKQLQQATNYNFTTLYKASRERIKKQGGTLKVKY
jgi:hypothetical protein